jgi:hypothetical protein
MKGHPMPSQPSTERVLIYNASNTSTFDSLSDYRSERLEAMRGISGSERLKKCRAVSFGRVTLSLVGNHVIQSGLTTCGSVWTCPVCSAKILTHRKYEVDDAITAWANQGGYFILETLTLCHRLGDTVAKQRDALRVGWEAITHGSFSENHKKVGQVGYLKVAEVTYGKNGFHVHFHVLRFMKGNLSKVAENKWMTKIFNKWQKSIAASGFKTPQESGHHYERVYDHEHLKGYFTKGFDNPGTNESTSKSSSVWGVLTEAIANPKSKHTFIWRTWESQSKGMRQMTWSRNLRQSLGLHKELEDEEIIGLPAPLLEIEREDIPRYGHSGKVQSQVKRHLSSGDLDAAMSLLDAKGIRYQVLVGD